MMIDPTLVPMIEELEKVVTACTPDALEDCHERLHKMIATLEAGGHPVPARLRALDDMLVDAASEDAFDNMPV